MKKKFPYWSAYVSCNGACDAQTTCEQGCIGCGACVSVCKFDAIRLNEKGVAWVDEEKCLACKMCAKICKRQVIKMHETSNTIVVTCSNQKMASTAKEECSVSCIGCGICEKICTAEAIKVRENLAVIDEKYCLSCGMCAVKCPRGSISDLRGILTPR